MAIVDIDKLAPGQGYSQGDVSTLFLKGLTGHRFTEHRLQNVANLRRQNAVKSPPVNNTAAECAVSTPNSCHLGRCTESRCSRYARTIHDIAQAMAALGLGRKSLALLSS